VLELDDFYCGQDYVHVMCYDYHGKWDKKTGHNAPLHSRATEPPADQVKDTLYF
jgi:GH18 family chitinase